LEVSARLAIGSLLDEELSQILEGLGPSLRWDDGPIWLGRRQK